MCCGRLNMSLILSGLKIDQAMRWNRDTRKLFVPIGMQVCWMEPLENLGGGGMVGSGCREN